MDSDSIWKIIIIIILIAFSAFFSAIEAAFDSLNKSNIKNLAFDGNRKAVLVSKLVEDFDRLLYTLLIFKYVLNISAVVLATFLFTTLCKTPARGAAIAVAAVTVALILFGEILPKSIAKNRPDKLALDNARFINALFIILTPLSWLFFLWKTLISHVYKFESDRGITEEELINIVEEAESEGGINAEESELIRSAIEFGDLEANDIITPRVDVVAIELGSTREEIAKVFSESEYSRLPVYDDSIDNILGLINIIDFYNPENMSKPIRDLLSPTVFVFPTMKISKILAVLRKAKSHLAVVTDEFGGTEGIITMEDVLEELVGEIWDEHDEVVEEFEKTGENEYRILCSANIDKMFELFKINRHTDLPTVGGWVIEELGKIPAVGDEFTYENLHVQVTKTDPRRVLEIKVTVIETLDDEE